MIENLLGNALKFTPPGGKVVVSLSQRRMRGALFRSRSQTQAQGSLKSISPKFSTDSKELKWAGKRPSGRDSGFQSSSILLPIMEGRYGSRALQEREAISPLHYRLPEHRFGALRMRSLVESVARRAGSQRGIKLDAEKCPECQTEFKYIAFRNIRNHLAKLPKLQEQRPQVVLVDYDDFSRNWGAFKAHEFLK